MNFQTNCGQKIALTENLTDTGSDSQVTSDHWRKCSPS